jgi:hypothetical protein
MVEKMAEKVEWKRISGLTDVYDNDVLFSHPFPSTLKLDMKNLLDDAELSIKSESVVTNYTVTMFLG